jgi:hypothetical protein
VIKVEGVAGVLWGVEDDRCGAVGDRAMPVVEKRKCQTAVEKSSASMVF